MKQNNDNRINVNNLSVGVDAHVDPCKKHRFNISDVVASRVSARGITLIALVITIIILLILAGVALTLTIGQNGIINRAKTSKEEYSKAQAKDKLELTLLDLQTDKLIKAEYNDTTYINERLTSKGFTVNENIVLVDGWQFEIDRNVPKIVTSLGRGEIETNIVVNVSSQTRGDRAKATLTIEIAYENEITEIILNGNNVNVPEKNADGKYVITIDNITANGLYSVVAKDGNKTNIGSTTVSGITKDLEISNASELVAFRDRVNSGETFAGKVVTLASDIDLSQVCHRVDGTTENSISWIPIGTDTKPFKGTILGNGNSITGLVLTSNSDYQGFIGVNEGRIEDINISSDCVATSLGNRSGILCGENRGTIENCTSNGTFNYTINTAKYWQGTICGFNNGGIIKNCANYGNITGYGNVGGIMGGCGNGGIVLNCLNTGDVRAGYKYDAGGICGNASQGMGKAYFFNCYNTGSISCVNYNVGGITGMSTSETYLYNCYNVGDISSPRRCGIAYWEATKPNLNNCFLLETLSSEMNDDDATKKTAEQLRSNDIITILNGGIDTVEGTASTESPWRVDTNNNINNGYPILKWQVE